MDQTSREELNKLIEIGPDSLSSEQEWFIYARRGYLNKTQKKEFHDLIIRLDNIVKDRATEIEQEEQAEQEDQTLQA